MDEDDPTGATILYGTDFHLADCFSSGTPEQIRANGRLIAGAPALLATLKALVTQIEYGNRFATEDLATARRLIAEQETAP